MTEQTPDLDRHRHSLLLWAKCQMPGGLRGKLDPEDLVSQTLLEGHAAREKFAGRSDLEVLAYLRRALSNNLIDVARKFAGKQGDVSLDDFARSSIRMTDWLAADHTSPSERVGRYERFERLAAALSELPDSQRIAVEMHYLQGLKVLEIAQVMNRSEGAVSLLLHRALTKLRGTLSVPEA